MPQTLSLHSLLPGVLRDPARYRPLLALVLGVLPLVVGLHCRIGELLEVDGADDHAGLETERHLPRVVELKDNVPGPPGINSVRRRVDHEPKPRER